MRWLPTWVPWFAAFALALHSERAAAEPERVHIACEDLTADAAAEVEARTRATLLTDAAPNTEIRIRCELGLATVLAVTGTRIEAAGIPLPNDGLTSALLTAVEQTLAASKQPPSASFPVDAPAPPPARSAPDRAPPLAPTARAQPVVVAAPPPAARREFRAGASALVAPWDGAPAFGGRALLEAGFRPWSAGAAFGGLTSTTRAEAFVPIEWHALLFGAVVVDALASLRFDVAVGFSVLLGTPEEGVVTHAESAIQSPFFELGLARSFRYGHVAITPELDLRLFPGARKVTLDGVPAMTLSAVSPLVGLGLTYEL
jgi:hypothetical protein